MDFLLRLLRKLLGLDKPTPVTPPSSQPGSVVDDPAEPAQISTKRVLLIIYNPVMDSETGEKLSQRPNWYDPDQLTLGFINEITEDSYGMARYEIAERIEVDAFPSLEDGFRYSPSLYRDVLEGKTPAHQPDKLDYYAILKNFNIPEKIEKKQIDEVWVFAFPYGGFYESIMAGKGAFWCNAYPLAETNGISRKFIIMGFSYERGIGEMLESYTHRVESQMKRTFMSTTDNANLWKRFTRYDKQNPGLAEIGTVHFAPNSERDYDWGNPKFVSSNCYDWYNFPNFTGERRQVNASEWGNGDIRLHHRWWLKHIPHVAGRQNGIHNNWWQYIMDPNQTD